MKKFLKSLLVIILIGGGVYFAYVKFTSVPENIPTADSTAVDSSKVVKDTAKAITSGIKDTTAKSDTLKK